jgi:hypothetical protein
MSSYEEVFYRVSAPSFEKKVLYENGESLSVMVPMPARTYTANPLWFFKKNQIVLTLDKFSYAPGETIKGSVGLKLKRPLQARQLTVGLLGLRIVHQRPIGNKGPQTQVYKIYDFSLPLDGENTYLNELYPFEIKIPADILASAQQNFHSTLTGLGKTLEDIGMLMQQLNISDSRVEWSVEARLNVPLKVDVVNAQKIVLS